jgi:CxxC motif-containing protein (DUF1111 family)
MRTGRVLVVLLAGLVWACGDDDQPRPVPATASATVTLPTATAPPSATPSRTASSTPSATPTPTVLCDFGDPLSGGATTVFDVTGNAFGQPARNLPIDQRVDFFVGNALFKRDWVTAPSSTVGSDGLGPVFNARSCSSCHLRDGRGRPPVEPGDAFIGLLFRLSIPGSEADGSPRGDPNYGTQFNQQAVLGIPAEGDPAVTYAELPGTYGDGEAYSLRSPTYDFVDLAFGPLDSQLMVSPRTAPFVFGLGLLAALDDATILAGADPDDRDGDGISGRPNYVWDLRQQRAVLGRLGWKANQSTIEQQTAGAFLGDIGITSSLFPTQNCTPVQTACAAAPNGGDPEVDQNKIDAIVFYTRYLAVPARRDVDDPEVLRGEHLFTQLGCASCHTATLVTGNVPDAPALSAQRIHPYTDLLLHDMGEDLADHRPDFAADGREWRTPPLWGIGLIPAVNAHMLLLHDGRARGLAEAILWHGGEGAAAREAFRTASADERAALMRFLESL